MLGVVNDPVAEMALIPAEAPVVERLGQGPRVRARLDLVLPAVNHHQRTETQEETPFPAAIQAEGEVRPDRYPTLSSRFLQQSRCTGKGAHPEHPAHQKITYFFRNFQFFLEPPPRHSDRTPSAPLS